MSNVCYTNYSIQAPEEELKKLAEKLEEARKIESPTDWGEGWLGNIFILLGKDPRKDVNVPGCRGCIDFMERQEDCIVIGSFTANRPMPSALISLCKEYAPRAEIVYESDAGSTELFTNDPVVVGLNASGGTYESCPLTEWDY